MRDALDQHPRPAIGGTRRSLARRLITNLVAATVPTVAGAATCGHPTTKAPTTLTWYSWGPEYPLPFTAGPGLNTRVNWMQAANQFAAVASGASGNTVPTPGVVSATPVPTDKLLEQQIEGFVADRDGLTVKVSTERFDRYHEKLATFAAAGMLPDVVTYDGANALPLLKAGALYPLQRLQGSSGLTFLAGYHSGYIESSMYRGRLYGLPCQARNLVLYVNKSMFVGTALPPTTWGSPDWTWARFLETAGQLTRRASGGGYRQMGTLLTGRPFWASLIRQNGGAEFSRDLSRSRYGEPAVHEALQWASDLVWRYEVAPSDQQNPNGQAFTFDGGTVAMWIWYQHTIPLLATRNLGFDWDVYPLPSSRQAATYADWSFVSMNANSTEVDTAWDLMRYLAGPDGDQRALRTGIAAPVVRGSEARFMTGAAASRNRAAAIQASQQPLAVRPLHESWAQLTSLIDYYLRPVWTGQERAAYATRDLSKALDGVLNGIGLGGASVGNAQDGR